jgi:short-subunit dehydrogenase
MRDKVVVITGASSGFGRGAALKFAETGANVIAAARRKRALKDLERQGKKLGSQIRTVETDVSNARDVEELASRTVREFGQIDVWVNNAGVGAVGRFDEIPLEEHEQLIRTNLLGTLYGSYFAIREFRKRGKGILINMSSFAGKVGTPYMTSYAASKFGIRGLGMALRQELEQNQDIGIRVCTIMPVSFDTPFFEHSANHIGRPVRPIPPVYDPRKVIDTIVGLAQNPRDEIVVGTAGKFGSAQYRISPKLFERFMARTTHKSQMESEGTASDSSGSVLEPMSSGTEIYGGWNESNGGSITAKLLGIAIPTAIGIALLARKRGRLKEQFEEAA